MSRPSRPIGELMDCPAPGSPVGHHRRHDADDGQDLAAAIAENAASAEMVQSAAGSQKSHPLPDQIAADQYLASKRAAQRGRPGIRIMRREGNPSG
jgi:hypothetical protein